VLETSDMVAEQDERAQRISPVALAFAKDTALASPMPFEAPVMRIVWPE
jgi:hypothetical protein